MDRLMINIATKAGAQAGAKIGIEMAAKEGASAGAKAGALAGSKSGAKAAVAAAERSAKAEADRLLQEALKNMTLKSQVFNIFPNGSVSAHNIASAKAEAGGGGEAKAGGEVSAAAKAEAEAKAAAAGGTPGSISAKASGNVDVTVKVDANGMIIPIVRPAPEELLQGNSTGIEWILYSPKSGENPNVMARRFIDKRNTATRSTLRLHYINRPFLKDCLHTSVMPALTLSLLSSKSTFS